MNHTTIDTVIFDLGGVLVDWNPEYLFRKIFDNEAEMRRFLTEITTSEWNELQDAGRPLAEATEWLVERHPRYEEQIRAYYGRWEEMLGGAIEATVAILEQLHRQRSHRLYALTNWSDETFPVARERFTFLRFFEGILVSGREKLKKPDPRIYQRLLQRYAIEPSRALFIDDSRRNVAGAESVGLHAIHFESPEQLAGQLRAMGILRKNLKSIPEKG